MGKYLLRPLQIRLGRLKSNRENGGVEDSPWIFSCKYPRTESLSLERRGKSGEDVFKSYNSLYALAEEGLQCPVPVPENAKGEESGLKQKELRFVVPKRFSGKFCEDLDLSSKSSSDSSRFFSSSDSNRSSDLPPGLASGLSSQRFFFSPGRSNSILEEAKDVRFEAEEDRRIEISSSCVFGRTKIDLPACAEEFSDDLSVSKDNPDREFRDDACCSETEKSGRLIRSESVAVHLNSPNPYWDFQNSMKEMVEAHNLRDWECLEEMLICYLSLNHKRTHKFILAAFADLVTGMTEATTPLSDSEASSENQAT